MNKTPSILVNSGFPVDQNGVLAEIDVPNVVATLNPPKKIVFNGTTLNYIPSTAAALEEFEAPNIQTFGVALSNYSNLNTVKLPSITTITSTIRAGGIFAFCGRLVNFYAPNLKTLVCAVENGTGLLRGCAGLNTLTLESLESIYNGTSGSGNCQSCSSLTNVTYPKIKTIDGRSDSFEFGSCTFLKTVQFGSEGNAVETIYTNCFNGCTQSDLTITVYTADGNAISGSPWGAANATIVWEEA